MKRLNPYLTAGITADWIDYLLAYQDAGADAVEIGLPFSDPMMDGATIQQASDQALRQGVTIASILAELTAARARIRIPLIAMTYANLVFRDGPETFCRRLAKAGITGLIVPDVPVDEVDRLEAATTATGIDLILLAAPVTTPDRLAEIGRRSKNFVYAVSVMDTTGERDSLAATAAPLAHRIKSVTGLPVLIGFGISTPEQAATAARAGDGVVVASALMRRVLNGASPDDLRVEVAAFRAALDQVDQELPVARAHPEVSGDRR